jgi:GMP reductase
MLIDNNPKLDFDDVLIVPQRSTLTSRSEIDIHRTFKFYHSPRIWTGTPVICANMSFSSFDLADSMKKFRMITCLHKYHTIDELSEYFTNNPDSVDYVWISIGYKNSELNKLIEFKSKTGIQPNICVDVPNGHMDVFVKYCRKVREHFPESIILAGNVTNTSSTQELLIYGGVDIVKIGIGGGSACTTRFMTGCGIPQLSCIIDNGYTSHGLSNGNKKMGLICSDGGHKNSGDVCKALCAGADFVMLGGYFAGADECTGEWEYEYLSSMGFWQPLDPKNNNEKRKTKFTYYGMSTHHAQDLFEDGKKTYRASEGTKITVSYKGRIEDISQELLGGIRSACCYIGARSIKDMSKCGQFCTVNQIHSNRSPKLGI